MNVLFVSWEMDPFLKRGGLGDVASSLPAALSTLGVEVRVIMPYYKAIKLHQSRKTKIGNLTLAYDRKKERIEIFTIRHPTSAISVYLLQNSTFFDVPKPPDTFPFFNSVIISIIKQKILDWRPDIIHCNDHHTGLIPLLLKEEKIPMKTLLTIHNLLYQGSIPLGVFTKMGYPHLSSKVSKWEGSSETSRMLAEGIIHTDIVTTVSPTYAREITTTEYGMGLDEILRGKEGRLFGILNGIQNHWKNNRYVKIPTLPDWEEVKRKNKLFLQRKLKLKVGNAIPLLAFIGRFDPNQKGIEILYEMLQGSNRDDYQMIVLGSGNIQWVDRFQWLSTFYPKTIATRLTFDTILAHQIYGGADFILIPSRFEPCGLIQMSAMEFGALPIAHKTGGLADSIRDGFNGFLFENYSAKSLENTVSKAINIWKNHRKSYETMVQNALQTDFSWEKSAGKYRELYEKLLSGTF
ncbi:glycogen synthase [Candidatus Gottesmanbacteria bacterium]|nr:glycogen synthase [Candidatus Gottesmanbacteria bacterium]